MTEFDLDPGSPLPPSEQLARTIRRAVAAGRYPEGSKLPSVRALAQDVLLNPNTVSKAYAALEREGVTQARSGSGVFVAPGGVDRCVAWAAEELSEGLRRLLREARESGLSSDSIWSVWRSCVADPTQELAS